MTENSSTEPVGEVVEDDEVDEVDDGLIHIEVDDVLAVLQVPPLRQYWKS